MNLFVFCFICNFLVFSHFSKPYPESAACVLNMCLRALDLTAEYLQQLLLLVLEGSAGTSSFTDDTYLVTARLLPDKSLTNFFPFVLNEFMLTLRIYVNILPDKQPVRLFYFFGLVYVTCCANVSYREG